ncbi:hypothetical protein AJ80_02667 [Polytolypa hystricis UAMH7299]|uniref:C2H2-type domain-containing protein n=1 Tax=Polytolypa hystricis (strain UAMH7299) TaxID=1447883 RepID=A0A2B7YQC3_POLH7|nr:hypothetical protein AJ80_02667 [Polytolypa hystricis UAMH7299]
MTNDVYDSDDARPASPLLKPQRIDYKPHESPPPFLPSQSESPPEKQSPTGRSRKSTHRHRKKTKPSIGDLLILKNLGHDRPDLITDIEPGSDCTSDEFESEIETVVESRRKLPDLFTHDGVTSSAQQAAQDALELMPPDDMTLDAQGSVATIKVDSNFYKGIQPSKRRYSSEPQTRPAPCSPNLFSPRDKDVIGDLIRNGKNLRPKEQSPQAPPNWALEREHPAPTISLDLRKYAISPSQASGRETLPALQSPPHSTSAKSPETVQMLPSIKATFPDELSDRALKDQGMRLNGIPPHPYQAISASSPPQPLVPIEPSNRRLSEQYVPPPLAPSSSFSHISPASSKESPTIGSMIQPYWQPPPTSDGSYARSPSSQFGDTTSTGYPTPTEPGKNEHSERSPLPNDKFPANGPLNSSGFKCQHPGCNAPPFQTQYLLNSHANVHSQDRPYYCPMKGCPRAEGGKGFKRKNEMIRHGLVHDSPGYVCPFCPDQQHCYPRPDNLQRHVRVHHVDKDRDDPQLRRVLAQRPEGGMRGRRRRNGV